MQEGKQKKRPQKKQFWLLLNVMIESLVELLCKTATVVVPLNSNTSLEPLILNNNYKISKGGKNTSCPP